MNNLKKLKNRRVSVYDCSVIELPKIGDRRGSLTPVYNNISVPFDIKRVFYTYDIPSGESRGAHAHKECHEFLISVCGSFEVLLDDGINRRTVVLNRPFYGLHLVPGIWASEQNYSSGCVCLVLTSHVYDDNDYIRDYEDYLQFSNDVSRFL
jgi:dTDP-4-dehydrorhamnose 3,5-epimerase-like enzyme